MCPEKEQCITYLSDLATVCHEQLGVYQFAFECARLALELDPQSPSTSSQVQRLLAYASDPEEVRNRLAEVDTECQHRIGHLLYGEGRSEEALALWTRPFEGARLYLPFAAYMSALAQGKIDEMKNVS